MVAGWQGKVQRGRTFGQQNATQLGNDRGDAVAPRRIGGENEMAQAHAQRAERLSGRIGAVEKRLHWHQGTFIARGADQGLPPAASGVQRRALPRQQRDRLAGREGVACIGEAVHNHGGIAGRVHLHSLLDAPTIGGFQWQCVYTVGSSPDMASDSDDPDGAAARLEAALDRIAAAAAARPVAAPAPTPVVAEPVTIDPQVIARLDGLIERLRGALGRAG